MDKIKTGEERIERKEVWIAELISKVNELVEEGNNHKEWHKRFFDKYNNDVLKILAKKAK